MIILTNKNEVIENHEGPTLSQLSAKTLDSSYRSKRFMSLENEDERENFWRKLSDVKVPPVIPSTREKLVSIPSFSLKLA